MRFVASIEGKVMADPWFFLSYARRNNVADGYVRRFFEMLAIEVGKSAAAPSHLSVRDIGFFDESIETGDVWDRTLSRALFSSRVLVCLYSRSYFASEWCGKEFQAFLSRFDA